MTEIKYFAEFNCGLFALNASEWPIELVYFTSVASQAKYQRGGIRQEGAHNVDQAVVPTVHSRWADGDPQDSGVRLASAVGVGATGAHPHV
ncbi:MAG: hypothetical protein ABI418_09255, partial [Jatrophihabitantaceae bacterium]